MRSPRRRVHALHDSDGDSADGAETSLPECPSTVDWGEVWDLGVGDDGGVLHLRGEVTEAGTRMMARRGRSVVLRDEILGGFPERVRRGQS